MNPRPEPGFPDSAWLRTLVRQALAEDVGGGDVTTSLVVATGARAEGRIVARRAGVVAGLALTELVWGELSAAVTVTARVDDGEAVTSGTVVAEIAGPAAAILTGERTALNFLQHLSGIATLTAQFVAAVAGADCLVLDTRKTIPGYRALAKYAVRAGGGANHRFGLYDRFLLKDNHWLAAVADLATLVARARREQPELAIEIEVDGLAQLQSVLPLGVDWILLDNFEPAGVAAAVALRDAVDPARRSRLEVSGNVTLESAGAFAAAGADAISIGRLTHSAPALDLALDFPLPGGVA